MLANIDASIRSFKNNLVNLANSKEHVVNQELLAEIRGVLSALESLNLDNMFLNNSEAWRSQFSQENLENHQAGLLSILADGEAMLYELRNNLGRQNLSTLQENQVRNVNYVAKERLRGFIKSVHPYSFSAYNRLENYANELGLRNRFKTIRDELDHKNEDKLKTWMDWTDKKLPEAPKFNTPNWREFNFGQRHHNTESDRYENRASITSRNVTGMYYTDTIKYKFPLYSKNDDFIKSSATPTTPVPKVESLNNLKSSTTAYSPKQNNHDDSWKKYATEAGIQVNFPGTTEQKSRYKPPQKREYLNFVLNPQPDTTYLNRPFTSAANYPINTEYRSRFEFPDSNKIDKFPWIKQY